MVSFNPNFGNGGGVSAMALFDLGSEDEDLPTSSVGVSGIYTDRGSHFVGLFGRFFPHPGWRLKGGAGNIAVKNELDIAGLSERADFTSKINMALMRTT